MRRLWAVLAALALVLTSLPSGVLAVTVSDCESVTGNLVTTNCGFETYTTDSDGYAHWTGWTDSDDGTEASWNYMYRGAGHSGDESVMAGPMGGTNWIEQNLSTTAGSHYLLEFYFYSTADTANNTATFAATLDGTTAYSRSNTDTVLTAWTLVQYAFTAADSSTTLRFTFRNEAGWWYVDDVSFTPVTANPPTLTLRQPTSQDDPTNVSPVNFELVANQVLNTSTVTPSDFDTSGTGIIGTINCTGTPTTCTIPVTPTDDGWTVTIAPAAGFSVSNLDGDPQTTVGGTDRSITYDATAPQILGPSAKVKGINVTVTWSLDEGDTTVQCKVDLATSWTPGCGFQWTGSLAKGEHTLHLLATDAAGNVGTEVDVPFTVKSGKRITGS